MDFVIGLVLVLGGGLLQGTFFLPMTLTRRWGWEHKWACFSLLGMFLFNWILAAWFIPDLAGTYRATPASDLRALLALGTLWGAGAILFGLGMDKLGMAVGYPVIMGLILSLGALIPLLLRDPGGLLSLPGLLLLAGTAVTIVGVGLCSRAAGLKDAAVTQAAETSTRTAGALVSGLILAGLAGVLSSLPNVGMNYAVELKAAAVARGASEGMAGNAAWALLFTAGFAVNFLWCVGLMVRRGTLKDTFQELGRNLSLIAAMAALWIGSFYLYGLGAARLGRWGGILGWPLFISLAILLGNLWGLWRGEWAGSPTAARRKLNAGLAVLLISVVVFGASSALRPR